MASTKIPFYGRTKTPRTRSGCLHCRQRKLKCDEKKPQCQRCLSSNRTCSYGLKLLWPDEALLRGIVIGRSKPKAPFRSGSLSQELQDMSSPSSESSAESVSYPSISKESFLNTTTEDLYTHMYRIRPKTGMNADDDDNDDEFPSQDISKAVSFVSDTRIVSESFDSLIRQPSSMFCSTFNLSKSDLMLFEFYMNKMCSTCSLLDGKDNGYRNVIIPISVHSPLLMRSILAVAANHRRFQDPRYHVVALQYRGSTLESLQRLLSSGSQTLSKSELLGTILMLCFFDISDGCHSNWLTHLDGASKVMKQLSSAEDAHSDKAVVSFIGQYFASHNIFSYTALADPTKETSLLEGGSYWLEQIDRPDQEIDCIVGCSKELMSIILEICQRIRSRRKTENGQAQPMSPRERSDALAWKNSTERRLRRLTQDVPKPSNSEASPYDSQSIATVVNTAEAFRQATLILLQHLTTTSHAPSTASVAQTNASVSAILSLMRQCPIDPGGRRSSSLWPLFIAACHVSTDEDRVYVLERFHGIESRKRFGNIRPVRKVVEHVWKMRDLRADLVGNERDKADRCFEWEDAMALLGSNLSLT